MVDREQALGVEGRGNVDPFTSQQGSATVLPDGKILIGVDANAHPAFRTGVSSSRRVFTAPPKNFGR